MRERWRQEDGLAPVLVGAALVGGLLGASWLGADWASSLLSQAGGELTTWVLKGAFWVIDLVAAQAAATPADMDVFTPVLEGPALPIWALAALVCVAALVAEVIGGVITGNVPRMVTAVFRAIVAGLLATAGGSLLLMVGGALSDLGRIALQSSGTGVDAPLLPLQEVLMETAQGGTRPPPLDFASGVRRGSVPSARSGGEPPGTCHQRCRGMAGTERGRRAGIPALLVASRGRGSDGHEGVP